MAVGRAVCGARVGGGAGASALTCMEAGLAGLLGGRDLVLPFSGIGTFRNEVAFVELAPGGHTHTLAQLAGGY